MRHLLFSLVVLAVVFEHTDALAASGRKGGGRVKCPKIIADKDTKRYKKGRSYACYRKVKAAKKKGYVSDTTARMSLDGNWQMTLGDPVNECPSGVTPPPPGGTSSATLTFTDVGDQVIMFSDLVGPSPSGWADDSNTRLDFLVSLDNTFDCTALGDSGVTGFSALRLILTDIDAAPATGIYQLMFVCPSSTCRQYYPATLSVKN